MGCCGLLLRPIMSKFRYPLICEMNGQVCTKYLEPNNPFSSPSQKAKIIFRSGCLPLVMNALAICRTADTPEALS